jgi:hypothetical protein
MCHYHNQSAPQQIASLFDHLVGAGEQSAFACEWRDGEWRNPNSSKPLEAKVIGWRLPRY